MRRGECIRNLDGALQRLIERQRAVLQPFGQRLAVEILHDEEVDAVLAAHVIQGADVRVIELRDRVRLAIEPLTELRIGGERFGQDLDRDAAIEPCVARLVDFAHAPRAEEGQDLVRAEASAGDQRHSCVGPRHHTARQTTIGGWLTRVSEAMCLWLRYLRKAGS